MKLPNAIFITGTDTSVGKTVVTACLAYCLSKNLEKVSVVKPVQTGTSSQRVLDIEFIYKVLNKEFVFSQHCYYSFADPLSPKTASDLAKTTIDTQKLRSETTKQITSNDVVLIEGAGGLLVPLNADYLMADLARDLQSPIIIVTRPGLGAINHTLLTVESAISRELQILGIVINNFPPDPGDCEKTNPSEIVRLTGIPVIGVINEDKTINVEQGCIGSIRQNSAGSFVPQLGGRLDMESFLNSLNS
jgi:dethiobiotin synthetase